MITPGTSLSCRSAFLALALVPALSSQAMARNDTRTAGTATAMVLDPIRAEHRANLSFGYVSVRTNHSGAVRISAADGTVEYLESARLECSSTGNCEPHRAVFAVSGDASRSYTIIVPQQLTALGRRTGSALEVTHLSTSSGNKPFAFGEGLLDHGGEDTFFVGGTLEIPMGTPTDVYRADLPISVAYN